jgi:N-carbamoylputrescine amidase
VPPLCPIFHQGVDIVVHHDLAAKAARRGWPFLRDRRVDAYQGLTQRYLDD